MGAVVAVIASPAVAWQVYANVPDAQERLAYFDRWAATQAPASDVG
jgi:hypothetical protein